MFETESHISAIFYYHDKVKLQNKHMTAKKTKKILT